MQASLLQLETSVITRIRVEANQRYPHDDKTIGQFRAFAEAGLKSSVEFSQAEDMPRRYFLKLGILLEGTEKAQTPYLLDVEMVGVFQCIGKDADKDSSFVEINGAAVLFGSIRELVMQMTSRGPYPPMVLPTVNFIPPDREPKSDGTPKTT